MQQPDSANHSNRLSNKMSGLNMLETTPEQKSTKTMPLMLHRLAAASGQGDLISIQNKFRKKLKNDINEHSKQLISEHQRLRSAIQDHNKKVMQFQLLG